MSTFRSDLVAGLTSVLTTFQAANPTLLRDVKRTRPASVGATPLAYVGNRVETLVHDSGTRSRTFTVAVVVIDVIPDSTENADRLDDLVDELVDEFTDNPRAAGANTLIEPIGVEDVEVEYGPVIYRGSAITLRGRILEGR